MKTRNVLISAAAVAVLALSVSACGDDDAGTTTTAAEVTTTTGGGGTTAATTATTVAATTTAATGTTAATPSAVTVTADNTLFDVTEITVKAGQQLTVTFVNVDTEADAPHNIHFRTDTEDFFTVPAEATSEAELILTVNTPGTFSFFCDTHPDVMLGVFTVTP